MGQAWETQQQQAAALRLQAAHATAPLTVTVQLHAFTVVFILLVIVLASLGAASVWQWFARPRCTCPLCEGQYELVRRLGAGGFGMVFLLVKPLPDDAPGAGANPTTGGLPLHLAAGENRERFVLKLIPVDDLAEAATAQIEARDLRALRHPGVVHYHEDFIHFTRSGVHAPAQMYVAIVMEHCEMDARTFVSRVAARGELIPQNVCVNIAAQLVRAVAYCHAQNVVHRDIKSQNVFLTQDGSVRLGDFGLAREVQQHLTSHTDAGTDCYKPPEALTGSRRDARAGDVWGVGLFLLELLSRRFMWQRESILAAAVLQRGRKAVKDIMAELPHGVYGYDLLLLVKECLHPDPAARPTAEALAARPVLHDETLQATAGSHIDHHHEWTNSAWQTVSTKRRGRRSGTHRPSPDSSGSSASSTPPPSGQGGPQHQGSGTTSGVSSAGNASQRQPWIKQDGTLDLSALTPEHDGSTAGSSTTASSGSSASLHINEDSDASADSHGDVQQADSHHGRAPAVRSLGMRSAAGAAPAGSRTAGEDGGGWQRVQRPRRRRQRS